MITAQSKLIISWLLSAMTTWYPPQQSWYKPEFVKKHPEIMETADEMAQRFESIATDLYTVVFNPSYVPFNTGKDARAKDAMYALGISSYESGGFRKDVDIGVTIADGGQSYCIMGLWMPPKDIHPGLHQTKEGWVGKDMIADRKKCFITGLDRMKTSWKMCANYHVLDRLAGYTIGHCKNDEEKSRIRSGRAYARFTSNPVTVTDDEVLESLNAVSANSP